MGRADQRTEQRFPFGYDDVFDGLVAIVQTTPRFKLRSQDRVIGRVVVSTGWTAFSYGENVSIAVERIDAASTMITIGSGLKVATNVFGTHRNSANSEAIINALSAYLQQHVIHSPAVPPAWHPDPTGRHQLRYWDGIAWTGDVSDHGVAGVDPLG